LQNNIQTLYSSDSAVMSRQQQRLQKLLECAQIRWSDNTLISVIRSPGRVNIMGRHVDHQGGNCNLMTIGCETLMAVKLRNDDRVTLYNLDKEFAPAEFSIGELVRDLPWDDWQALVGSKKLARLLKQYGVNWADYIKAVFLRFQKHFDHKKLHGMDIIVSGNVPMAAGLSSSSTLVVGAAEAVVGANRLDLEPDKLVSLCGEGEWFVGTRGGAADHAAVKLGECNKVVKVKFFDFAIEKLVNFPTGYTLIVCDSKIQARKSGNAKDQFNHRVSCYRIGLLLLKKFFPQYAASLQHLRDFSCEKLNIPLDWFYKLLSCLPEYANRSELEKMLPEADLQQLWNNHNLPDDGLYPIRGVVFYGLAECARSARFVDCLEKDILEAGRMMNISHDGDRVKRFDGNGNLLGDYRFDTSDAALQKLIADVQSGDPERVAAAELWRQPGSYRCSLPEIDLMVDLANSVEGAVGAQLAGAGLGGCMMVLIHNDSIGQLTSVLNEKYYKPRNLQAELLHCRPIAGACAIKY
ncbi:MAG: galactokinase, partial [Lentisphaeria bacterium]|nr:galactokinase [Lentisphaeria bacterium]